MERQQKEVKTAQQRAFLDLPEVILIYIISLLPMKDAAKSATVSKKWRELWSSIPEWTLEYNSFPNVENKNEKFISFVDRVINFHQGPGIQSMKIHYDQYDSTSLRAEGWIRRLVENNIVRPDTSIYATIQLPRSLFTCVPLAELRLNFFFKDLPLPGYAFLPNLKVVYLEQTRFHASTQFERLIKGCPALEDLHMKGCAFFGPDFKCINFSHPKIKSLNIERCGGFEALKVYIWMPNLLEFRFKGIGFVDQRGLTDLASLSTAVLEIEEILYTYRRWMVEGLTVSYGPNMSRILASVCHVSKLSLSDWCIEYLSTTSHSLKLSSSDKLEYLDLKMWPNGGHSYVVSELIKHYPNLRSLAISFIDNNWGNSNGIFDTERENYPQPPPILETVHQNLKILKTKGYRGYDEELRMMKFLLRSAVALEKFAVDIPKCPNQLTIRKHVKQIQELAHTSPVQAEINLYYIHGLKNYATGWQLSAIF